MGADATPGITLTAAEWAAVSVFAKIGRSYAECQLVLGDVGPDVSEHLNRMLDDAHAVMTDAHKCLVDQILQPTERLHDAA